MDGNDLSPTADEGGPSDQREREAVDALREVFDQYRERVFFSRQLEVWFEDPYFHWITNRALRDLAATGEIHREVRPLGAGREITLMWHRGYRYYRREASRLVDLVAEYSNPNIGGALGIHGELMVLEGFALKGFVTRGRNTRSFGDSVWTATQHDLDFIFERDGLAYGVEVKNTLPYMEYAELLTKIEMCRHLGIRPVFAVRMLPRSWINVVNQAGGFALIMKYQPHLYEYVVGGDRRGWYRPSSALVLQRSDDLALCVRGRGPLCNGNGGPF